MTEEDKQPVDRKRRAKYIASVTGFCLFVATGTTLAVSFLGIGAAFIPLIEMFVTGLISLATATTLAYVGGSVLDYNGGIGNMFMRNEKAKG